MDIGCRVEINLERWSTGKNCERDSKEPVLSAYLNNDDDSDPPQKKQ